LGKNFEELDHRPTDIGDISLRRRRIPELTDADVLEVKLGDEFLMSSLFTEGEVALANRGLEALTECGGTPADVVVGGLGLGYTAHAALSFSGVESVLIVEALLPVIDWHRNGLVPLGDKLESDPRCQFIHGNFFSMAGSSGAGFDPDSPGRQFDAVLLDIDHSPQSLLNPQSAEFYTLAGLRRLTKFIRPQGVFAMWSNDPPADAFLADLAQAFTTSKGHIVSFRNPMTGQDAASTIYVALSPRSQQTNTP
jgi:spermidine synthase